MPVEIDGFAVLAAIGQNPMAFPAVRAEAVKTARAFVGKQLKDKTVGVVGLRLLSEAIGADSFDLIADGLADAEIKALLTRIDKHNPALKTGAVVDQRRSVVALARGETEPATAPPTVKAAPATKREPRPKVERSANSRAMRARKKD